MFKILKLHENKLSRKNIKIITDTNQIDPTQHLYVNPGGITRDIHTFENKFGKENVLVITELPKGNPSNLLAKYSSVVGEKNIPINNNSHVVACFEAFDFSKIEQISLHEFLVQLHFKVNSPTNEYHGKSEKIKFVFFVGCKFSEISDSGNGKTGIIISSGSSGTPLPNIKFIQCEIVKVIFQNPNQPGGEFSQFINCTIDHLSQTSPNAPKYKIFDTEINILETAALDLSISKTSLKLFHHSNLDTAKIKTDNVKISFDRYILSKINREQIRGYLNTYYHLQSMESLVSERHAIESYINYFESKIVKGKSILFALHSGYSNIWKSLFWAGITLLTIIVILDFYSDFQGEILTSIFYPIELFKNYIFRDFSFRHDISWIKLGLLCLELFFIYMFFSFAAAIRKFYGFKIPK